MDWPGFYDGTAPTVIEADIPQVSGGNDSLEIQYHNIILLLQKFLKELLQEELGTTG